MATQIQGRADLADASLPPEIISDVLQTTPEKSVMLSRAKRVTMSSASSKQPVLSSLPEAYWVNGDTGLKQTTKSTWDNLTMTAEELAVIVPIPDSLVSDANIPLWDMVRPLLVEAIGKKIDQATLFGIDKPNSWPEAVVPSAIAAGNVVELGTGEDIGVDIANVAGLVARDGFSVDGFASEPGLQWDLIGLRTGTGSPIYSQALAPGQPSGLYGMPLNEVKTGAWDPSAKILAADWSTFVVGVRQDVTFDMYSEGVITDTTGKVVLNLMQQDCKALRVVFRAGFQVANPLTRVGAANQYPAGVLVPAPAPASGA